jgi:hypothetical protein
VLRGATSHPLQVIFRTVSIHNAFNSSKVGTIVQTKASGSILTP